MPKSLSGNNNDESEAEKYYLKSCKSEFVKSQYRLAYLYDRKDKIEDAMEYYEKGIEQDYCLSKFRLANLCNRENEIERAKMYYDLAASDMVEAKNNLAGLYFEDKNYQEAIKNYDEAIVDGCKIAIENIGDLYDQTGEIEKAISYYQRNSTIVSCQIKLGDIFRRIDNLDEAIVWYKKAVETDDTYSAYTLGLIYEELKQFEEAKKYFTIAVDKNDVNSRIHLGRIYYNEECYEEAKDMFEITANEGNIYSQHMLALIYENYYNDYNRLISGDVLLKLACDKIKEAQELIGGRFVFLECEDKNKLEEFYSNNGFVCFGKRNLEKDERTKNE